MCSLCVCAGALHILSVCRATVCVRALCVCRATAYTECVNVCRLECLADTMIETSLFLVLLVQVNSF